MVILFLLKWSKTAGYLIRGPFVYRGPNDKHENQNGGSHRRREGKGSSRRSLKGFVITSLQRKKDIWWWLLCFGLGSVRRDGRSLGENHLGRMNRTSWIYITLHSLIGKAFSAGAEERTEQNLGEQKPKTMQRRGKMEQVSLLSSCDLLYIPNTKDGLPSL